MQWIFGLVFVILIIGLALFSVIRDKKRGKKSCGCGCAGCAMGEYCKKQ